MKSKILIGVGITMGAVLLLTGCGKADLKNGSEVAIKIDNEKISADDIYKILKEKYAKEILVDEIDKVIFKTMFKDDTEIEDQVNDQIEYYKAQYSTNWEDTLKSAGYESEDALKDEMRLSFQRDKAIKNYLKENVSDGDINSYYKDEIAGEISAKHILISTSDRSEEEAENLAKDIIKKLKNGEKFEDLAKEYSDDTGSKENGGDLGYFGKGEMVTEFEDAAYGLKVDEYTKEPVKTSYGYHIILKTGEKEKAKLEDIKDTVIEKLVEKKLNDEKSLYVTTLEDIRKDYGLKIKDSTLKSKYKEYIEEELEYYNAQ